jgi:biotin carboxyl carrier protein
VDLEYIESLAELVQGSRVTEVSVRRGQRSITVRRQAGQVTIETHPASDQPAEAGHHSSPAASGAVVPAGGGALVPVAASSAHEARFEIVKAHRVGVFHRSGRDDGEPLVGVGDWAAATQQLGSIESMTLFDEVDSPVGGRVVGVFVADGDPVEYGQPLFHLEVTDGPDQPGVGDNG